MYTVTINQRDRVAGDRVSELLQAMGRTSPVIPFARTVGDEAIAVFATAEGAVDAALIAMRPEACGGVRWNVGIGVGAVDDIEPPVPGTAETVGEVRGPGAAHARRAVEQAQRIKDPAAVAVAGKDHGLSADASAVLHLVALIAAERSSAEWRVLELLTPGVRGQQRIVAEALGITPQAVSKAVARGRWNEEHAARPAVARLLTLLAEPA